MKKKIFAKGISASSGFATGRLLFDWKRIKEFASKGEGVILIKKEIGPQDTIFMGQTAGMIAQIGSLSCHAAIVARELGKPLIVNPKMAIDFVNKKLKLGNKVLGEGDVVSIDAYKGEIIVN
ncbi:MAG: PEP-utilizing enzyme [Candidatus Micrarchaeota archaeon]